MSTLWASHTFTVLLSSPGITDTPFLSYDPALARVRIDEKVAAVVPAGTPLNVDTGAEGDAPPLNANPGAEVDASGWLAFGGALARSTAFAHAGAASVLFTPDGVSATGGVIELSAPNGSAVAGGMYQATAWVYSPAGFDQVRARLQFLDAGGGFLSSVNGATVAVAAGTWTLVSVSGTAPASTSRVAPVVDMLGTPAVFDELYVDELQANAVPEGWVTSNSSILRSTLFAHSGVASIEVTPNGVNVTNSTGTTAAASPAGSPGTEYQVSAWVLSPLGWASGARARFQFLDAGNAVIGASVDGPIVAIPAGVWTFVSFTATAPALTAKVQGLITQTGSAPASQKFYVDDFVITDDVRTSGPVPAGAVRVVERSTDLINWTTVRGGAELPVDTDANPLSDWEFTANAENHYRVRVLVEGELYWTWRDSISVVLDAMWLKPIRRPFLSRTVTMTEHGEVQRAGRSGVFAIAGRSLPVAVVDLHDSQRWTLELMTIGQPAAREMDLVVSSGDVFYLHGPADCPVPEGYYVVGDTTRARRSTRGERRYHSLPLTMVASPAAVLEGVTFTWRSMLNRYATWGDVAAEGLTWREIDELIGTAEDVVI